MTPRFLGERKFEPSYDIVHMMVQAGTGLRFSDAARFMNSLRLLVVQANQRLIACTLGKCDREPRHIRDARIRARETDSGAAAFHPHFSLVSSASREGKRKKKKEERGRARG